MSNNSASSGGNVAGVAYDHIRPPLDPNAEAADASEFSWGAGLEPSSVRGKPPSEGGRYTGLSPECEPRVGINRR
jgi:hypothetical protein